MDAWLINMVIPMDEEALSEVKVKPSYVVMDERAVAQM